MRECPDCGVRVGSRERCQELFEEVIAREFSDAVLFGVHRMTMDCYCLQHERYCKSFKSFAAHLAGLCCAMEFNSDPAVMRAIRIALIIMGGMSEFALLFAKRNVT